MKFLSVTGPKEDIDRVVNDYLSKYEIHLENALSELKTVKSLRPYIEINPYKDKLTKAEEFASMLGTDKIRKTQPALFRLKKLLRLSQLWKANFLIFIQEPMLWKQRRKI